MQPEWLFFSSQPVKKTAQLCQPCSSARLCSEVQAAVVSPQRKLAIWLGALEEVYRPHQGEKCQPHVIAGKISLEIELGVHHLTMIPLILCGFVMFLKKNCRRESLGVPVEGEEKETMCLLSFNKNNSEMYLSKTHGLRSFFFLVQAWCAACSPSSPHSLIAQRLLYWAHFTTEGRKKIIECLKIWLTRTFFPLNF